MKHAGGGAYPHAVLCIGIEGGHLGLAGKMQDRDERASGIALQPLAGADPHRTLAVEFDRFHRDAV